MDTTDINQLIAAVKDDVIAWRRHFHKYPELSYQETKTSQFVYDKLCALGNLEVSRPTPTSVMARLTGAKPGKTLALRADMDALPIQESSECEFASCHDGIMHACGHDTHTAMLLGTATVLSRLQSQIQGEVRFLFQHAEEMQPGGSREMMAAGVLQDVDQIMGLHVMSHIPVGQVGIVYGPAMAAADTFDLIITGKGGHASQPHLVIDPIAIAAQVVTNLQHVVARNADPQEKLVVAVTTIHGGTAYNIIPDTVTIQGSVRSFDKKTRAMAAEMIERIGSGIATTHGATCKVIYNFGYDSVTNDLAMTKVVEETVVKLWGDEAVHTMPPLMGSEDFSFYLNEIPGTFIFIGGANPAKHDIYPLHNARVVIDEGCLDSGVKLSVHAALKLLSQE